MVPLEASTTTTGERMDPSNVASLQAQSIALPKSPRRFSELGISSFILSILNAGAVLLDIALFIFLVFLQRNSAANHALVALCILLYFGILTFAAVGIAVGLAGIFQPNRLKIFSLLGTLMNFLILLILVIVLLVLVLMPGASHWIDSSLYF